MSVSQIPKCQHVLAVTLSVNIIRASYKTTSRIIGFAAGNFADQTAFIFPLPRHACSSRIDRRVTLIAACARHCLPDGLSVKYKLTAVLFLALPGYASL